MEIKNIESFIPDADGRIRQYIADTLGDDFKVKMARKQPPCHHSVKYNVDFNQTGIAEAGNAALIWKEPLKGLYRMSGATVEIRSKDSLGIRAGAAQTLRSDIENANFRLPVVIIFGGDQLYSEMHKIDVPDQIDAYWVAGFIREGNIQVIDCFTQDLLIPIDCHMTTEGYFQRNELKDTDDGELLFHASCFTQPL